MSRTPIFPPVSGAGLRRVATALLIAGIGVSLSGCVIYPVRPGGGWCYWHPYRCR